VSSFGDLDQIFRRKLLVRDRQILIAWHRFIAEAEERGMSRDDMYPPASVAETALGARLQTFCTFERLHGNTVHL